MRIQGLEGTVEVFRDDLGVPHVRAGSAQDAFLAQGYVHAADRLWQMLLDRRRASGRAAEWLGAKAVSLDVFVRRLGLARTAWADYQAFDDETRAVLDAYAAGVNAFLETSDALPTELRLLDATPEPWRPWDCGAVFKVRHVLMGAMDAKLWRARLLRAFSLERTVALGTAHGAEPTVILPVGERRPVRAPIEALEPSAIACGEISGGSNSWALHGSRTASGLPLMAGDSHRTLEAPNVYYQNHVACPDFDAIGLSMAGVPGMFHFGHNAEVAWCVTHAMADTQDLYVERFDADGRYETPDGPRDPERRTETVEVRDGDPAAVEIVTTHNGPVVLGDPASGTAVGLRWTATDRDNPTLGTLLPMLRTSSVDELEEVMRDWVGPCNSFLMADRRGTIGYLYRGRVPVRSAANRWAPVPGWTGEHAWGDDVPFDDLPRLRDPETGFIATANNRVVGDEYPHYLGMDYAPPHRASRLVDRLEGIGGATVEDMAAIHADRLSRPSWVFVEAARRIAAGDGLGAEAQGLLGGWDRRMDPDSSGAAVYAAFRESVAELLCERGPLAEVVRPLFGSAEPDPTAALVRVRRAVPSLLAARDAWAAGPPGWDALLADALDRTVRRLTDALGPDPADWAWGRLHRTAIAHPLSSWFPDEGLDPPRVGCGGDGETVQATGSQEGFAVEHSSVVRYVFDLGDWDRSGWVVPLGGSGDPRSPHHADQQGAWAEVRLYPMTYSWSKIEAGAETHERLEP